MRGRDIDLLYVSPEYQGQTSNDLSLKRDSTTYCLDLIAMTNLEGNADPGATIEDHGNDKEPIRNYCSLILWNFCQD